jgi:hypothetical protein
MHGYSGCTKSLRDSFGLTALVIPEGMHWCAASSERTWEAVRLPRGLLDVRHGEAYALSGKECANTIPISHKPCHIAFPRLSLQELATFSGAPQYNPSSVSCDLHGLLKDMCTLARPRRSSPLSVKGLRREKVG